LLGVRPEAAGAIKMNNSTGEITLMNIDGTGSRSVTGTGASSNLP
jgi:hypothetical protein